MNKEASRQVEGRQPEKSNADSSEQGKGKAAWHWRNLVGKPPHQKVDLIISAGIASLTIITCFVLYWGGQVRDVIDLLKLAYG